MEFIKLSAISDLSKIKTPKLNRYLPKQGEGKHLSNQIAVCAMKIAYRFLNDGDKVKETGYSPMAFAYKWLYSHASDFPEIDNVDMRYFLRCLRDSADNDLRYAQVVADFLVYCNEIVARYRDTEQTDSVYDEDDEF